MNVSSHTDGAALDCSVLVPYMNSSRTIFPLNTVYTPTSSIVVRFSVPFSSMSM